MRKSLALAMVAGTLGTVALAQEARPPTPPQGDPAPLVSEKPMNIRPDDKGQSGDLREIAGRSGRVFEGALLRKTTSTPPGMRVLVTEYTFEVHEWFKGGAPQGAERVVVVRETGGVDPNSPDGSGMCTVESHKLTPAGRYLVFLRPDAQDVLFPFDRVFQVFDAGAKVADEHGRVAIGLREGVPLVRETPEVPGLSYLGTTPPNPARPDMGAPRTDYQTRPTLPAPQPAGDPIPAESLFKLLRPAGAAPPQDRAPAGLNSADVGGARWNYCGYVTGTAGAHNYACWLPDNNNFAWWNDAEFYWDQEVNYSGSGGWIFGFLASGGNPIRNENPVAANGRDNAGVPSDAQMTAGGYGTWAANASPNGICFIWYQSGTNCARIVETDTFINPVNGANQLQFRKSVVHEMGHALGLGHEDRYVADMVSGTWRMVPNYSYNDYLRTDDRQGVRNMLSWANANAGASWSLANWRDIASYNQSHPNVGTSGDVGPNVVQLSSYNVNVGDSVTASHLHVENRGRSAYAGAVSLNAYLTSNPGNITGGANVWSGGWGSYGAEGTSYNFPITFTVPNVPTGTYYLGWTVSAGEAELAGGNDAAIMTYDSSNGFALRTISVTNNTPFNDGCSSATAVVPGTYTGATGFATTDGSTSCGFNTQKDVWFSYTPTCAGTLVLDTCGSGFDTVLSVHSGCPGTSGNVLACDDDAGGLGPCSGSLQSYLTLPGSAGTTYLIRLSGYDGASGAYTLHVAYNANAPSNDTCAGATLIGNGTVTGSTTCASNDGSAVCGSSSATPDVWYRYVAPGNGALHVDTCTSGYDTVLSVHSGCPGSTGNELACNDDSCGLQSVVDVPVSSGQSYYIRVSGYNGSTGSFTLHTGFTPVNDGCSNAIAIGNGSFPFSTVGATTDGPSEAQCPFCCNDPSINQDIWYRYTASCTGTATVDLCGANYDSKVAVYAGGSCPSSPNSAIACNDDTVCAGVGTLNSFVAFPATAGSQYLIRVGGYSSSTGNGTMVVSCYPGSLACVQTNGGFESGAFTPGWTQFGNTGFSGVTSGTLPGAGLTPHGGTYGAYFGPTTTTGGIQQTLSMTAGQRAFIDFWYACAASTPNSFSAVFDGQTLVSFTDDTLHTGWTHFGFQVTALSNNPVLTFTTRDDPSYINLDDITVCVIPTGPQPCYANCDGSTQPPILNVADFSCFLTKYSSGDAYANCDNSTQPPVLNVNDFSCFLTKYAAGCP